MIRNTQIIFFALLMGQAIFAAVVYTLMPGNKSAELASSNIFFLLPFILMLSVVGASWIINSNMQKNAPKEVPLADKLRHYQQRVLIRLALIEAGVFAAGVFALVSANTQLLLLMVLGIGVFVFFRPGIAEFVQDYRISGEEERMLNKD